ncbi:ArsI/CadI family heavy metal resistance metalloenzyme [Sphingomonas sp. LHG3406-1]|uniref:ArsI/CadI family heavy metal resistance metalloenzyme n=1 Tax=Sphingomonas sp. LHG3406-1 TaxID=2804617 RepID=UPI002611BD38|nr:ArsI/CadI family heavy metal resistance metalloenzyme [Sphingomonas sp. LHG3406-1]
MKRLHVHVGVTDLSASVHFYSTLFGAEPTVAKDDYAKWMLDDPRVNFAISVGGPHKGIEHLGIQVDDRSELVDVYARLKAADRPVLEEGSTTCCYAKSEKSWTADPDGVLWEAFHTSGTSTVYGDSPELAALASSPVPVNCCAPATA